MGGGNEMGYVKFTQEIDQLVERMRVVAELSNGVNLSFVDGGKPTRELLALTIKEMDLLLSSIPSLPELYEKLVDAAKNAGEQRFADYLQRLDKDEIVDLSAYYLESGGYREELLGLLAKAPAASVMPNAGPAASSPAPQAAQTIDHSWYAGEYAEYFAGMVVPAVLGEVRDCLGRPSCTPRVVGYSLAALLGVAGVAAAIYR